MRYKCKIEGTLNLFASKQIVRFNFFNSIAKSTFVVNVNYMVFNKSDKKGRNIKCKKAD